MARAGSAVTKQSGLDGSTVGFLSMLVDQTCDFIEKVGQPNAVQLEVIKLHAEIIRSVAAGRLAIVGANYRLSEGTAVPDITVGVVDADA